MKMTNEERQALIEALEDAIQVETHSAYGYAARIALAALTAEPVAWEVKGILCHTKEEADKYVGTPVPLIESLIDNTAQQYEALAINPLMSHNRHDEDDDWEWDEDEA